MVLIPHQNSAVLARHLLERAAERLRAHRTPCTNVAWPGYRTTAWHMESEEPNIRNWFGGLVDGMRDASGQMYMRNRYYDPATGQFTQPDPIGLAGGLNSYGFAAGDPVTYNDPYGLSASCDPPRQDCPSAGTHTAEQLIGTGGEGSFDRFAAGVYSLLGERVAVSGTAGVATVTCSLAAECGTSYEVNVPQVGRSVNVEVVDWETASEAEWSLNLGLRHFGLSIGNGGVSINVGKSTPASPVSLSVDPGPGTVPPHDIPMVQPRDATAIRLPQIK